MGEARELSCSDGKRRGEVCDGLVQSWVGKEWWGVSIERGMAE